MDRKRVTIIGGGISGLAAAHRLQQISPSVEIELLEAGPRIGGVIRTTKKDGFLIEGAADNFISTPPSAIELCKELGLGDDLVGTNPNGRGAMVLSRGKLELIPDGFMVMAPSRIWPLVSTKILSPIGKLRSGCELLIPKRKRSQGKTDQDESLKSFVTRRFGTEMFERLVQPLVGGIYTADPDRLSVAATMPRFLEMEQTHGSLIRAMMKQRRMKKQAPENGGGARYSMFMTLRGGMSQLIDALGESLPAGSIKLNSPVSRLTTCCAGGRKRWSIQTSTDSDRNSNGRRDSDAVILAAPASHAANILDSVDDVLSHELAGISYASCAVASLAFRRDQIGHLLGSFGFVVPHIEDRHILSCSFSSLKYEGRAPEETVLMRVFIGGACQPELLRLPDEQLLELAAGELSKLLDVKGQPILRHLTRQTDAMPQYHVGHQDRVEKISQRLEKFPTLAIASNAIGGVGVPNCIESGKAAAERVAQSLTVDSLQKLEVASLHP